MTTRSQVTGRTGKCLVCPDAGLGPRAEHRLCVRREPRQGRGQVLGVAGHHGDQPRQRDGDLAKVLQCEPAARISAGLKLVAGQLEEVAEGGPARHGSVPASSRWISAAYRAAWRHALRSSWPGTAAAVWARTRCSVLLRVTTPGSSVPLPRPLAQTLARFSGRAGSEGAKRIASLPFAAAVAAYTNWANMPLAGSCWSSIAASSASNAT